MSVQEWQTGINQKLEPFLQEKESLKDEEVAQLGKKDPEAYPWIIWTAYVSCSFSLMYFSRSNNVWFFVELNLNYEKIEFIILLCVKFERTMNHESHTLVCVLCWASTRYLKFTYFENVFFSSCNGYFCCSCCCCCLLVLQNERKRLFFFFIEKYWNSTETDSRYLKRTISRPGLINSPIPSSKDMPWN